MNVFLLVNDSPWGSTRSATALRLARAVLDQGHSLAAVYFQGDGVYNAISGDSADPGTAQLSSAWSEMALAAGCELLLCSSACARRLPGDVAYELDAPYRLIGRGAVFEVMDRADRWVSL